LTDFHVICLSSLPWDGLWTSRHALCQVWAGRGLPVTFVDPPANLLRRRLGPRLARRDRPAGLTVVQPPGYLPYGALQSAPGLGPAVLDVNARRYAAFVAGTAAAGGRPVLLFNSFMPVLGYRVAPRLRPARYVYHRADELRSFPTFRPRYLELEARVARQADLVVCVSPAVRDGIAGVRPDAVVIPNGVDPQRFVGVHPNPRLVALPKPVIALVGTVDGRTDPALVAAAADAGTLVVAGPVHGVELPSGVVALGAVDRDEVPGILAAADVAVVCYRDTPGDVLKVYEYLAAGLPVVAGDFPGLHSLRQHVRVVGGPAEMTAAIAEQVAARTPVGDAERRAVAADCSWERRADQVLAAIGAAA